MHIKKFLLTASITLILLVVHSGLFANEENLPIQFQFNGTPHQVTVLHSNTTDLETEVWLTTTDGKAINISAAYPGQNLGPIMNMAPNGQHFMITWFLYRPGDVQLLAYDSQTGFTRLLPLYLFKTAYPLQVIYKNNQPSMLLFMGNNSNNTDIFYYSFENGGIENITNTPESDQTWKITQKKNKLLVETTTAHFSYKHHVQEPTRKGKMGIKRAEAIEIEHGPQWLEPHATEEVLPINTVVGFGDSITWGTIRMDITHPEDYYHPEWSYLSQLEEMMAKDYGIIRTINLGVPGNHTWEAWERMSTDFMDIQGFFCLVMLGTNDVATDGFDVDTSMENLENIIESIRSDYGMLPIISTIPPQKDELYYEPHLQLYIDRTEELNSRIKEMATRLGIVCIDTYTAFFESVYHWEDLMEPYRGNHPNPQGHQIIAQLFKEQILLLPPAIPTQIITNTTNSFYSTVQWDNNQEFDMEYYSIQWGYTPTSLNHHVNTNDAYYRFISPPHATPFGKKLYFNIQAIDKDGNSSDFSPTHLLEFR